MIENLLMCTCAKHCHKRWSSDKAIAKIKRCSFFCLTVYYYYYYYYYHSTIVVVVVVVVLLLLLLLMLLLLLLLLTSGFNPRYNQGHKRDKNNNNIIIINNKLMDQIIIAIIINQFLTRFLLTKLLTMHTDVGLLQSTKLNYCESWLSFWHPRLIIYWWRTVCLGATQIW